MPVLTAASLVTPRLPGLQPREITLAIVDNRPLPEPERRETEAQLTGALREAFGSAGVKVQDGARHRLAVELTYPQRGSSGMDINSCIEMAAKLEPADGPVLSGTAVGCAELRNLFGMSYGADTSMAFEQAADTLLKELNAQYVEAQQMMDAPEFKAAEMRVPPFSRIFGRQLELIVVDQWSGDGRLGRNLREELGKALRAGGVALTSDVGQTLTLTVSKPDSDFQGRSRHTCIEIAALAKLRIGSAFSHAITCRGPEGSLHHNTLNDVLKVLDAELDRVPGGKG